MYDLKNYEKSITSQGGEDGLIREIFNRIKPKSKICVEFGAWNGEYCSNTWTLWHDEGWTAVLIEGDKPRCDVLVEQTKDYPKVIPVNKFVAIDGENSLDNILSENLPENSEIDLISIDIDGDDYYILKSIEKFLPRVVVIEYNPTIPPEIDLYQKPGEYFGASALALLKLGASKGYKLAAVTTINIIMVKSEDFVSLGFDEPEIANLFVKDNLVYIISSYGGDAFISKPPSYGIIGNGSIYSLILQKLNPKKDNYIIGNETFNQVIVNYLSNKKFFNIFSFFDFLKSIGKKIGLDKQMSFSEQKKKFL